MPHRATRDPVPERGLIKKRRSRIRGEREAQRRTSLGRWGPKLDGFDRDRLQISVSVLCLFPFGGIDGSSTLGRWRVLTYWRIGPDVSGSGRPVPPTTASQVDFQKMKLIGFVVALYWTTVCFAPIAAQDISSLGSLLSNMQQCAFYL